MLNQGNTPVVCCPASAGAGGRAAAFTWPVQPLRCAKGLNCPPTALKAKAAAKGKSSIQHSAS